MNELEVLEKAKQRETDVRESSEAFLAAAREALGDSYSVETGRSAIAEAKTQIGARDKEYSAVSEKMEATQAKERATRKDLDDVRGRLFTRRRLIRALCQFLAMWAIHRQTA